MDQVPCSLTAGWESFAGGIVNEIVNFHCHSGNASMDDMDAAVQVVVHQLREKTH